MPAALRRSPRCIAGRSRSACSTTVRSADGGSTAVATIHRFARPVASARHAALPPEVVLAVKTFVLDTLGVGVAGSGDPLSARIAETVAGWGTAAEATVWGSGLALPAQGAA